MRDRIIRGWPFTDEEWVQILAYCVSDIDALERLLPYILAEPEFDLGIALYHGEFVATSALMEHRGVPVDMVVFRQLADKRIWSAVRDAMVPMIDAQYVTCPSNSARASRSAFACAAWARSSAVTSAADIGHC